LEAGRAIKQYLGDLDRVSRFVKLLGMVSSMSDLAEQPQVMNGASDFLHEPFGEKVAPHARSAAGMAALPHGNSIEIEMTIEVA
jgi:enamine deaminase RidA (YjgF/YER057c/UK114 family)